MINHRLFLNITAFTVIATLLLSFPIATSAQTQIANVATDEQERQFQRCEIITKQINIVTTRYENNKQRNLDNMQRLKTRLEQAGQRLQSKGYDVSKITADLKILGQKIATFSTEYGLLITELNKTKQYACGKSNGQFLTALGSAGKQARKAHLAYLDAVEYYHNTIRPDLEALKTQTPHPTTN